MPEPRPLNFLWRRTTLDFILEGYFVINILLGGLGRPIRVITVEENETPPLGPDTLIGSMGAEMALVLQQARTRGIPNIGLFHMGDEEGKDDRTFYAHADYVMRNYWSPAALAKPGTESLGVIWVPNGYRTGVGPSDPARLPSIAERSIMGFFAGNMMRSPSGQREAMLEAVRTASLPFAIVTTRGFGKGFGPVAYSAWLSNSRFALVPAGISHETIRLYDALEAGAIPIMLRSPVVEEPNALGALGTPPFILLDSWDQLAAAYTPYADAQSSATIAALEERRQAVLKWWMDFKKAQQTKVCTLIDRAFARSDNV